ncbi:quinol:cytochrome c oxidoreductase, cytoplasmic subunit [Candidatus Sulfopaludibacter sp. SbA6]|nr:quinol:cytochrome c oxidoreductase, cytoplasmic subunit [Candidatus Sulfopaludibacter sp. SbA6]
MAENKPHLPDLTEPAARHEHSDVNAWMVGKFGIALALLCIVAMGLLFGLFRYFQSMDGGQPLVTAVKLPPAPTLEITPALDLKAIRAAEDQLLTSYGWVDREKGVVRIPIARAIDLLAQRGLPSRPQNEVQTAARDVSVPTESGLGPKMQPPGGPLAGELK